MSVTKIDGNQIKNYVGNNTMNTFTQVQVLSSGLSASAVSVMSGITSTGTVTAEKFQGDGSGLVNIPAPSTMNHAVLSNLDYASAGHTGFARTTGINTFSGIQTFTDGATFSSVATLIGGLSCASPAIFTVPLSYEGERPTRNIVLTAAGAIVPTAGGPAQTKIDATNFSYYCLEFDPATAETAFWNLVIPDNMTEDDVLVDVYWKESTGEASTNVIWKIGYLSVKDDDVFDNTLTYTTLSASNTKNDNTKVIVATGTMPGGFGGGQNNDLVLAVQRDATTDTYTQDARLIKCNIKYKVEK